MRKSKEIKIEAIKALAELQEKERQQIKAEAEEREVIEGAENQLTQLCEENGLFCGVILTPDDIAGIVKLMCESKDNIKIKAKMYFTDNE
jgi:hypothetical protein